MSNFDEAQMRRVFRLMSREKLIDLLVQFMNLDARTHNTLLESLKNVLEEVSEELINVSDNFDTQIDNLFQK
jgi:molecular chaperone GrpE (heat shock protein)